MKTSSIFYFIAIAQVLMLCSCNIIERNDAKASSTITNRTYSVGNFRSIETSTIVDFKITQGDSTHLSLQAPSNLIDNINVEKQNGVLRVSSKNEKRFRNPNQKLIMTVIVPTLDAITSSGTGNIKFIGKFTASDLLINSLGTGNIIMPDLITRKLSVTLSGTGDVDFKGKAETVNLETLGTGDIAFSSPNCSKIVCTTSGTGDIELTGSANYAEMTTLGTGDVEAKNFTVKTVKATSSATGDIVCHATESFMGSANGTGEINVYGNPRKRVTPTKKIKYINE